MEQKKGTRKVVTGLIVVILAVGVMSSAISATDNVSTTVLYGGEDAGLTAETVAAGGVQAAKPPDSALFQSPPLGSYSHDSDLLEITVGEQTSSGWNFQYDPVNQPDIFIRSVYGEYYAVASNNWGGVIQSTSFTIDTYFGSVQTPDTATLHYGNLSLTRQVIPPEGSDRSFSITFVLSNTGNSTLENVRFFQGVDYDISDSGNDYAWYTATSDTIWQNDDRYFKNGFHGSRPSSHHDCNAYGSMWSDMQNGVLNDLEKYPASGTADCGIALQWDAGNLTPGASWDLTITFYFGEAAGIEANAGPDQTVIRGKPVTFDASRSSSVGNITSYEWDLNNDSVYEVNMSTPIYVYGGFAELGEHLVTLRVTDNAGRNDTDTVKITVVPNVDLLVSNLTFSPATTDGESVPVWATVRNNGTDPAPGFYVRFEVDKSYFGRRWISNLPAGNETAVTQTWIAQAGSHNLTVVADEYNAIAESNETNNERTNDLPAIPYPDLTIIGLSWTPTEPVSGELITFTATVANNGSGSTVRNFYVRFEVDGSYIGHQVVSGLGAGNTTTVAQAWTAVWADTVNVTVDEYDAVAENNASNNKFSTALPGLPFPDLIVTNLSWTAPEPVDAGDLITIAATIENTGGEFSSTMSRPLKVAFLVNGEQVGSRDIVGGIRAEQPLFTSFTWTAQPVTNPAVCVVADYSQIIPESNESNNQLCKPMSVVIASPDLTVTQVTFNRTGTIHVGEVMQVTAEVKNIGIGNYSGNFDVGFFVNGTFIGISRVAGGLPAGTSNFSTFNWIASSGSNPVVNARVDFFDIVQESNETNNEKTEIAPVSIPYADLEITALTWEPAVNITDRDPVVFNVTVKNAGAEDVITDFKVYFEIDRYFTRSNVISGGLAAGASTATSFIWTATPGAGHNATVKADPGNIIPELNKTNNNRVHLLPFNVSFVEIFDVKVESAIVTTGVGGETRCGVRIYNYGSASSTFTISTAGLNATWCTLNPPAVYLLAGQQAVVDLHIAVPSACETSGTYPFQVSVTSQTTNLTKNVSASLMVESTPVLHELLPANRTAFGSTDVTFSWSTYTNASTTLYLKAEGDPAYTTYTGAEGLRHNVTVMDLARNTNYSYYARSTSACGANQSAVRTFYIGNGIRFTQNVYEFTVERDYNQLVTIAVQNTDSEYHELLVEVPITFEDLVLGFVGDGSQDNVIPLNPGESKAVTLAVQCSDAMHEDYEFTATLTSSTGTETLTDTAQVKIHVHVPAIDYELDELSVDNVTLMKTFRLTNTGDPITDLTISVADNFTANAYIEPVIEHYRLAAGESLEFHVIPILSSPDFQPHSPIPPVLGDIIVQGGGVQAKERINFTVPEGKQPYKAVVSSPGIINIGRVKTRHCNNNPNTKTPFDVHSGTKDKVRDDPLIIRFSAGGWEVRPHDIYVSINGHEVGSLINTIPEGYYKFEVDPAFLIYPEHGVAKNYIELHSVHQNGGHYLVSSDVEVRLNLINYETWVIASSQEEANQIAEANLPPGFYESPDNITLGSVELTPETSSAAPLGLSAGYPEVQIGRKTTIQTTAEPNLDVDATFSNGDGSVHLAEVSPGVYQGTWTPRNPGEPSTGQCVITIRAKGSGVQSEKTQTVKILSPTKLYISIIEPADGSKISQIERLGIFGGDYFGVQPVRVQVTDDAGSLITAGDVQIVGSVEITKLDKTTTAQSLSTWIYEGNGAFRCDWQPPCAGDYKITVKVTDATSLGRSDDTDSVTGTLEEAELKLEDVKGPSGTIDPYHANYNQIAGELWNGGDRVNRQSQKYPIEFSINKKAKVVYSVWDDSGWFAAEVSGAGEDLGVLEHGKHIAYLDLSRLDGGEEVWRKSSRPYHVRLTATDDQDPDKEVENEDIRFNIQREPFFILMDDVAMPYKIRVSQDFANKAIEVGMPLLQYLITWLPILGKVQDATQAFEGVFNAVVEREAMPGLGKFDTVFYYKWRVMPYAWDTGSHTYEQKWVNPVIDLPGTSYNAAYHGPSEVKGPVTMKAFLVVRRTLIMKNSPTGAIDTIGYVSYPVKFWAPQTMGVLEFVRSSDDWGLYFDVETTTLGSPFEAKYVRDYPSQYHYPIYIYGLFGPEPTKRSWGRATKLYPLTFKVTGGVHTIGGQSQQPLQALGVSVNHTAAISSQDEEASFIIGWAENETELAFALYKPDGTKIDPTYAEGDPDAEYYAYGGLKHYRIRSPEPGPWRMEVDGPVGVSYSYDVYVTETGLMFSPLVERNLYYPGESIPLRATLVHEGLNLTGVTMTAEILRPDANGTWEVIPLLDDGSHGDGEAEDGVYANNYTTTMTEGTYEVELRASGEVSGTAFARTASLELLVQDEPVVLFDTPEEGAVVSGLVAIQVSAVDAAGPIASYEIWIDGVKASDSSLYMWSATSATGPRTITAKATDGDGYTGQATINVTVFVPSDDGQPPQAPTGLSVTAMAPGNALRVNWTANSESDIAGYHVYRSQTSGGPYTEVRAVAEPLYIDRGLTGGVPYYYVVTASDYGLNESTYSAEASGAPFVLEQGFNGSYADYGVDTNTNGLFERLAIDIGLTAALPGHYSLRAELRDHEGASITGPVEFSYELVEGNQTVQLQFPGWLIHEHGVSGAYDLRNLSLLDARGDQIDSEVAAYMTAAYNFTDFEPSPVAFTDTYTDFGTDNDGNGLYDLLTVNVGVAVATVGDYIVTSSLTDNTGTVIERASYFSIEHAGAAAIGNHTVPLEFSGSAIRRARVNGPYTLRNLALFSQNGTTTKVGYREQAYTTGAYNYTEFQKPAVAFTGNFSDYGTDTDTDGKYEYLTIEAELELATEAAGTYNVTGRLEDGTGKELARASSTVNLTGDSTIKLNFSGFVLHGLGIDGPYKLKDLLVYHTEAASIFDLIADAYTTAGYTATDFEPAPVDLTLSSTDISFSDDAPDLGEPITITATIRNVGSADAVDVVVQFFDGRPAAGGTQIGADQTVPLIALNSTETAQVNWTAVSGRHNIFVRIDPYGTIGEANETNNQAYKQIAVTGAPLPDLTLSPEDIQLTFASASSVPSSLRRLPFVTGLNADQPASNPTKFHLSEKAEYRGRLMDAVETINSSWTTSPPTIDGTMESGEWDGATAINITFLSGNCSMLVMNDGENMYLAFAVVSDTTNDINDQDVVQLGFDGDHDNLIAPYGTLPFYANGTCVDLVTQLFGDTTLSWAGWLNMDETGTDCVMWYSPSNPTGPHVLATGFLGHRVYEYSVPLATALNVSPGDTVGFNALINDGLGTPDAGDFRTRGLWPSTWNGLCDFTADGDLVLATEPVTEPATLKATVHNIGPLEASDIVVQFFDGDPNAGGTQISRDQTIASILAGGIGHAEVLWDVTGAIGTHTIYVRVDPVDTIEETNEGNNVAFRDVGVPGVTCSDPAVSLNYVETSVTDDPVGDGYNVSNAPANVDLSSAKGFMITATGTNGTYVFNITFLSPVSESFKLFKLPHWHELPYNVLDTYTIQVQLTITGGVLDPAFILAPVAMFDTNAPANPYPSISGTFNGTITPNQTLSVSQLYIYPCAGTGGHAEYAAFSYTNGTKLAEAHWDGYQGDWHHLSFPGSFTLQANETYNYTLVTGSYPQLHHQSVVNTTGGIIRCTEFVDVNGNRHSNTWIPAIRLES
jgi:subtilase family serine protease